METMFVRNFGGTNKEYYGIFESGLFVTTDLSYFISILIIPGDSSYLFLSIPLCYAVRNTITHENILN